MTCVKCKNPIEINATECEWCGISFSNNAPKPKEPKTAENKISALDSELLALLEQGKKKEARRLFQERTGANKSISRYKIAKLDFFRKHQYATEKTWDDYAKRSERRFKYLRMVQALLLLLLPILLLIGAAENSVWINDFRTERESFLLLSLLLLIITAIIFWISKTKRI